MRFGIYSVVKEDFLVYFADITLVLCNTKPISKKGSNNI